MALVTFVRFDSTIDGKTFQTARITETSEILSRERARNR